MRCWPGVQNSNSGKWVGSGNLVNGMLLHYPLEIREKIDSKCSHHQRTKEVIMLISVDVMVSSQWLCISNRLECCNGESSIWHSLELGRGEGVSRGIV